MRNKIAIVLSVLFLLSGCEQQTTQTGPAEWEYAPCLPYNTIEVSDDRGTITTTEHRATLSPGEVPREPVVTVCDIEDGCQSRTALVDANGDYYHECGTRVRVVDSDGLLIESHSDLAVVLFYELR